MITTTRAMAADDAPRSRSKTRPISPAHRGTVTIARSDSVAISARP
jgi:hypothetical protein